MFTGPSLCWPSSLPAPTAEPFKRKEFMRHVIYPRPTHSRTSLSANVKNAKRESHSSNVPGYLKVHIILFFEMRARQQEYSQVRIGHAQVRLSQSVSQMRFPKRPWPVPDFCFGITDVQLLGVQGRGGAQTGHPPPRLCCFFPTCGWPLSPSKQDRPGNPAPQPAATPHNLPPVPFPGVPLSPCGCHPASSNVLIPNPCWAPS